MTDTKELLQRIAALRLRLNATNEPAAPSSADPLRAIATKVARGVEQHELIETSLRAAEPRASADAPPVKLTGRGARLLRKGREMLQALRKIADDAEYSQAEGDDPFVEIHRDGMAMLDLLLRTAQGFSPTVSMQLRMCDGLDVVLSEIEERVAILCTMLAERKKATARIDELADDLKILASMQSVSMTPLQALAEMLLDEARAGQPLRFLYASPAEPARFAAAHGINVAQVMARVLMNDGDWQPRLVMGMVAALVHDVGMVRVPAEILLTQGPLDSDERRLIEKHTSVAEDMLIKLWPGGGWPLDAARDHHERGDGTGYPLGQRGIKIAPEIKMLAVCDVYAAMCAARPHRPAFDTRTALTETLLLAERDYLDRESAERLLALSFYPIGSAVELSDGAHAVVIGTHTGLTAIGNPARPVISVLLDVEGQPIAWPTVVDLADTKDRSIVRSLNADERRVLLRKRYPQNC